jgi:hypothetical protein
MQTRNAYLLVYERAVPNAADAPPKTDVEVGDSSLLASPPRPTAGAGAGAGSAAGSGTLPRHLRDHRHLALPATSDTLREIIRDNQQFLLDQQAFSPMFVRFVFDTLSSLAVLQERPGEDVAYLRSQAVIEWATRFTLQVVAHAQVGSVLWRACGGLCCAP